MTKDFQSQAIKQGEKGCNCGSDISNATSCKAPIKGTKWHVRHRVLFTEPLIVFYCMELQPVQPSSKYLSNKA